MNKITSLIVMVFTISNVICQVTIEPPNEATRVNLYTLAKAYKDSIVIRWAPERYSIFDDGKKNGYRILRRKVNGSDTTFKMIAEKHLPWTKEQWQSYLVNYEETNQKLDTNFVYVASIFFAKLKDFRSDAGSFIEMNDNIKNSYAMSLVSASRNINIANAMGLRFVDKNVEKDTDYEYQVDFLGKTGYNLINNTTKLNSKPITSLNLKYEVTNLDQKVAFKFAAGNYNSYKVYRRTSRSDPFVALSDVPFYTLYDSKNLADTVSKFYDTIGLKNYQKYYYRFVGQDGFGDEIKLFDAKAMPVDKTPPLRPFPERPKQSKKGSSITIKWSPGKPIDKDLAGYNIYRGTSHFFDSCIWVKMNTKLISKSKPYWKDYKFFSGQNTYYYIESVDKAGNAKRCEPVYAYVRDVTPPAKPKWISGKMDSLGIVRLKSYMNKEDDFMGFKLYVSNAEDHEFSPIYYSFKDTIGKIIDSTFIDTNTVNSLTENLYYKLKAYDYHYNESKFSDVLIVKRIDTIAPTCPVFKTIKTNHTGVTLTYASSESRDLKTQFIYRKNTNDTDWVKISELNKEKNTYLDKDVKPNETYFYSLRSVDFNGNYSPYSFPVYTTVYRENYQDLITSFTIVNDTTTKLVRLNWDANLKGIDQEDYFFIVYKKIGKKPMKEHKNNKQQNSFEEKNLATKPVTYAVKLMFNDGTESKLSELKTINPKK